MREPGGRDAAPGGLRLVQDLCNTNDVEGGRDRLQKRSELVAFGAVHGLPDLQVSEADVANFRQLREALRQICQAHAGQREFPESAELVNHHLRTARFGLTVDGAGRATLTRSPQRRGLPALLARLAEAIIVAAESGDWQRLKACSAEECRWVFYDRSPAGRGRWCSMQVCGSRAKMRAYRSRKRSST